MVKNNSRSLGVWVCMLAIAALSVGVIPDTGVLVREAFAQEKESAQLSPPITTKVVEYEQDGVVLEGYLAMPEGLTEPVPGVVVFPEWWGHNDYVRSRAEQLARLGYVAFAADMYGKGKVTTDPKQAGAWASELYGKPLMRTRAVVAFEQLRNNAHVDAMHTAAIGYCFGGTCVLQLAYSGADVRAVVSFHGNPTPPMPEDDANIKASILVCNGAADPFVKPEAKTAFHDAMARAKTDYVWIDYAKALHGFTRKGSEESGIEGVGYNEEADRRSWKAMRDFFDELLGH